MRVLEKVARMPRGRQAFHGAKSSCPSQQFSHRSLAIAIELYPLYSAVGGRQPHSAAGLPHIGDRGDVIAAETWALESVNSINKSTTIEDQIQFHKNLALVYASEDKTKIALKELIKVENYVDPWDAGFWLTLGNIYEKQKDNKNALDA